jgi:adenylyl-sulfate kinase
VKTLCTFAEVPVVMLDGDVIRAGLSKELSFSEGDITENVRRTAEVAKLLCLQGFVVLCALVSPRKAHRILARAIAPEGRFVEVYLDASLTLVEGRDPKGLYAKARRGELPGFFNVGGVYEEPARPDLCLPASREVEDNARTLFLHLQGLRRNPLL